MDAGDWNIGGERLWIALEIQYSVRNRSDFWRTIFWPNRSIRGITYLSSRRRAAAPSQDMTLEAFNVASGQKELQLEPLIRRAENPLRYLSSYDDVIDGMTFAGYEQVVTLTGSTQAGTRHFALIHGLH